jgi:acetylornithine deacetylase/succinyl-diaminopimelate desuccinylase-like protein
MASAPDFYHPVMGWTYTVVLYVTLAIVIAFGVVYNSARIQRASTDANIPLSLGLEAIAIGTGGSGGGAHTVNEWYDPAGRDLGLKRILLLTLALSGVPDE